MPEESFEYQGRTYTVKPIEDFVMDQICEKVRLDRLAAEEQAVSCSHWGMH